MASDDICAVELEVAVVPEVLAEMQEAGSVDFELQGVSGGGGASDPYAVLYVSQSLTEEEQAQARENIGALSEKDAPISPTIKVEEVDGGVEITATDKDGTTTAVVKGGGAVSEESIKEALGYTPADDADLSNKLDAYIITGAWDNTDDVYSATLDDSFNWENMAAAINANHYVGCMLRPEDSANNPICLTLGGAWLPDSYAVFTSLYGDGWAFEMYLYSDGSTELNHYQLARSSTVDAITPIISETDITAGSPADSGRPYHVID